ncbi:MAG: S9 family peptidase [Colwellia sp.]|nr:S9 family peptidase [Colwellia sp.]
MTKYTLILILVFSSFSSQATSLINDERIKEQKNCFSWVFTDYSSWQNAGTKVKSKKEKLQFDALFGEEKFNLYKKNLSCSTFKYEVDGNDVHGYVIKPKFSKNKLPVLIFNRGGNANFGKIYFPRMFLDLFPIAKEGFVIIGSNYRGTFSKNTLLDEFGGKDVNDVTALLNYIPNIEGADAQRIGMYGHSRGGMQTFLALKQTNNIKAIATIAGVTDLLKELEFRPFMEKIYTRQIPDYEKNKVAELEKRSVLKWVNKLSPSVPILLLHGEDDKRASVNNSIALADALAKNNIPHKLVLYPEGDHGLTKNREKANKELVSWFHKYL